VVDCSGSYVLSLILGVDIQEFKQMMVNDCHWNDERILRFLFCPTAPLELVKGRRHRRKNAN